MIKYIFFFDNFLVLLSFSLLLYSFVVVGFWLLLGFVCLFSFCFLRLRCDNYNRDALSNRGLEESCENQEVGLN